ncbi:histidine kinase dimerization/phosphoacceptor domain-containing protein [Streptosporangium lutulentum]
MHDPAENQPPLDRAGIALRYLFAMLPMLFYGVVLVAAVPGDYRDAFALVDVGLGAVGLVLMRWRRHRPWPIALATALLTVFSGTAASPAYVAYVSLCTHRRWPQMISGAVVLWLGQAAFAVWRSPGQTAVVSVVAGTVFLGGLTVFGLYVRSRRDLAASRRAAALTAVEQAKLSERVKIAHEMHDVLAHRISLLSMLAGGLAYRTDLTAEETREIALAIQENAHQSLNELRTVLGALRRDGAPEALSRPWPTWTPCSTRCAPRVSGSRWTTPSTTGNCCPRRPASTRTGSCRRR